MFWKLILSWAFNISRVVWDFVRPMVVTIAKQESAGYISLVRELVTNAEVNFGPGEGSAKYEYVVRKLKLELGERFSKTPFRVFDYLIHAAVAELAESK